MPMEKRLKDLKLNMKWSPRFFFKASFISLSKVQIVRHGLSGIGALHFLLTVATQEDTL